MKIDILHTTISPCENERRIFNQAITASQNGKTVHIAALKVPPLPALEKIHNITIQRIGIKNWVGGIRKFLFYNCKLFWFLIHSEFKILHAHDLWVLPASVLAAKCKRKKIIYDAHEYYRGLEIFVKKPISGKIWAVVEWLFIDGIDKMITINSFFREFYLRNYPKISAPEIIMNFPRRAEFLALPEFSQFSSRPQVALYQGIFKEGRGLEKIIQVMKEVTFGNLELIGYGELESDLKNLVESSNLQHRIHFSGKVIWHKLLLQTQKARCGLVLFEPLNRNYTYASPNKFFEYVLAGTPVIASNIPSFKKFFSEFEVGILVDPNSKTEIKNALEELLCQQHSWQKFHDNCLAAGQLWNWEAQENRLLELYETLL